jgi:multisubunit Na+/H+ antiporter MnhG subunit
MTSDDLLMVVVVIGLVMSSCYLIAECLSWRSRQAAETKGLLLLRDLYKRMHSATKPLIRAMRRG